MHHYTPDFIIRRTDGKCFIVEVKREEERDDSIDGENGAKAMATRAWTDLNPDRLKYEMIFTSGDQIGYEQLQDTMKFL